MHPTNLLIFAGLLIGGLSCTPAKTKRDSPPTSSTQNTSVSTRPASVNPTTPGELVRELYRQHDAGYGPFSQTDDRSLINEFFEKELADLIWEDVTSAEAGESVLDTDPLYNTLDTDVENVMVHPPIQRDGATEVLVTFDTDHGPQTVCYRMAHLRSSWRISDILYPDGSQLFRLLSDPE